MTRVALGVAAMVAGLSGCAGPARYVSRDPQTGTGVVAIPANTDNWPGYNRRAALALIEKDVGAAYEIVHEGEVVTGQATTNNQQVNNEQTFNSSVPFLPAEKQTVTSTTTTRDIKEYRISYRKLPAAYGVPMSPEGRSIQQTQFRPGAPGAGVRPAGGVIPQGAAYPAGFPGAQCADGNCPIP